MSVERGAERMTGEAQGPPEALIAEVRAALGAGDDLSRARLGQQVVNAWRGESRPRRSRRSRRLLWAMPLGAVAAAAMVLLVWRKPPLDYELSGGHVTSEGDLQASDDRSGEVAMKFSDGSRVTIASRTAARVEGVEAHGARLRVRDGRADLDIIPRPGGASRWAVHAGPFVVTVKGTRFSVAWSERRGTLEVRLQRGRVEVSGPSIDGLLVMRPGQILRADITTGVSEMSESATASAISIAPIPTPEAPPHAAVAARPVETEEIPGAPARPLPRASSAPSADWPALVRAGAFATVVEDAESLPREAIFEQTPLAAMEALADAARYERKPELSRSALTAIRRRFPRSRSARDAAFHLGRLAEDRPRAEGDALSFYDAYLAEAPRGSFAAEALARKMSLLARTGRMAEAQKVAREYLQRHPNGEAAPRARALVQEAPPSR